jgi:hypothetical protein
MNRLYVNRAICIVGVAIFACAGSKHEPAGVAPKDDALVSTTLTTTAGREEAVNPPAVASLEQPVTPAPVSEPSRPAWPYKPIPVPAYVPRGHYESRGLFGRQRVWVTEQPQQYQYRTYSSCSGGRCGR